ncbi:MAG: 4-(cytidine 5'-diphospho)-2-C-methyl-D-erythritol kinase [Candidatus Sumerlaeota bacterium]|nr:4-(cytidine 5'-diphospho)-2-C-methyl-D-erythritol kinase [Candidatus Sumerlaeota bacterium]
MGCDRVAIRAFAKVNLYLRILGRRSDGYHEIETVMHPVGLCDELHVERHPERMALKCESPEAPAGNDNTVCRAWEALRRLRPTQVGGCEIALRKGIPARAGLGGASADAAAALLALNRLFGLDLDEPQLHGLAAEIGSDVPFFLGAGAAVARGRGERIRGLPGSLSGLLAIAVSNRGVSTADAYALYRPDPSDQGRSADAMEAAVAAGDAGQAARGLFNAFERLIFPVRPDLARTKEALARAGASGVLMTGSGSAVFAMGLGQRTVEARDLFKEEEGEEGGRLFWTSFRPCPCEWV